LDAKLRVQMRAEISKIHHQLQTTFIYVTHDQMEAMTMATRIAVITKGRLQQLDTPQNLYNQPANLFVAGFIGSPAMNFFPATIRSNGGLVVVGIRPEDIHDLQFVPPNISAARLPAQVDVTELMGNEILLYLITGKNTFVARVDPRSQLRVGNRAEVALNMEKLHVFDAATEKAIY
jgi:multiple sugar transport system ATP-binding protein